MPVTHSAAAAEAVPHAVAPPASFSPPLAPVVGPPLALAPVADVLAPVSAAPSVDIYVDHIQPCNMKTRNGN